MKKLLSIISSVALSGIILSQSLHAAELNIVGISEEKKSLMVSKLKPRLEYITRRAPSPWRADDAAFFLERLLIRDGHPDAAVDWSLPGNNVIKLDAKPGERFEYGEITAANLTAISQDTLYQYFLQPLVDTELVNIDDAPYIAEYSDKGANNVTNYLKSQGYWNASVSVISEQLNRTEKNVDINLSISTGNKLTLQQPVFRGTLSEDLAVITPLLQPYYNQPATTENINLMKRAVDDFYRKNGYQFATIKLIPQHGSSVTTLLFQINSGKRFIVDKIIVKGADKTKDRRIRRYFDDLKDKDYDSKAANDAVNKLISTGAFTTVTIEAVPDSDTSKAELDIVVTVIEADARAVNTYAGFGTYEGGILGASYTDYNYHGSLRRVEYKGEISGRGLLGEISVTEPMFAAAPIQLNTRLFLIQRDYEGYDTEQAGAELSLTWTPTSEYSTRTFLGATYTSTETSSLSNLELGPAEYLHVKAGISQTVDFRNSTLLPSEGFYSKLLLQYGNISGDASNEYMMFNLQSSYRHQLTDRDFLVTRFSTGAINPQSEQDLPIDVRLFSGGTNSQRAYDERELGPRSLSNDPLGGQAYWAFTTEYIRTVRDPIKLAVFYDIGQVYRKTTDYSLDDASHALGLGLRIDLPIGPVRLEYGHNMNRRSGEPNGTFHFSIGASF